MTEKEFEDQLHKRERALWPEEPSPFENPFNSTPQGGNAEAEATKGASFGNGHNADVVESGDERPGKLHFEDPWEPKSAEPVNDVWLNGPPPDDFPFAPEPTAPPAEPEPWPDQLRPFEPPFVPVVYTPDSTQETVRRSGLAWSAGIVFFGAVAFMLFLGWLADLVLGSSPWGIVVGVVLGSVIGFVQFFRISSQIYAPKNSDHRPLLSRDDEKE